MVYKGYYKGSIRVQYSRGLSISTNTILGVPYCNYSIMQNPILIIKAPIVSRAHVFLKISGVYGVIRGSTKATR